MLACAWPAAFSHRSTVEPEGAGVRRSRLPVCSRDVAGVMVTGWEGTEHLKTQKPLYTQAPWPAPVTCGCACLLSCNLLSQIRPDLLLNVSMSHSQGTPRGAKQLMTGCWCSGTLHSPAAKGCSRLSCSPQWPSSDALDATQIPSLLENAPMKTSNRTSVPGPRRGME